MKFAISVIVFWVIFVVVSIGGWIANIVKLVDIINDPVTGMMILRGVGIFFAPLGIILGLFF